MKKTFLLLLIFFSLKNTAQGPVIEATYFPVRNTMIKQVWDVTNGTLNVPSAGINQVWDYRFTNNQFLNITDTFDFKFLDPANSPYYSMFPAATHVTYIRTPMNNLSDSMYVYWEINRDGMYYLGGYNIQSHIDSSVIFTKKEFYAPNRGKYLDYVIDTSYSIGYAKNYNNLGYRAKVKTRKIKHSTFSGYGTLHLPNKTYNNVALIKEKNMGLDSVFVDILNNGNYVFFTINTASSTYYQFMRNNTFGSTLLMFLNGNYGETSIDNGWYTLPADFGSISGNVYTNASETNVVTSGEAYLYRENSNFTKNDILATTPIKSNGVFQFDSIPYGEYRIAVRPNLSLYPNSKITYYGDTTNWINANTIITNTTTSPGHKIHLQYHPAPAGTSSITGVVSLDWTFNKGTGAAASNPVPGIGIVVKKHPNNVSARVLVTDSTGKYDLGNLEDGAYTLFVDIPGLHMTGTYNFSVSNSAVVNSLDFMVGKDSIHPINSAVIGLNEISGSKNSSLEVLLYPNPFNDHFSVEVEGTPFDSDKLELTNLLGGQMKINYVTENKGNKTVYHVLTDNSELSAGVYFIKLTHQHKSALFKLMKH